MRCANRRGSSKGSTYRNNYRPVHMNTDSEHQCVLYFRGKQQIHDQIQQRVEEKLMQDEIKEIEKQQVYENQERINQEDLKVGRHRPHRAQHTLTGVTFFLISDQLSSPGSREEEVGAAASAGGDHAHQC